MQKIIAIIICWCWFWQASAQPNITAAEYFIDTDPGFGNATGILISTPSPDITNQSFSVTLSALSQGVHSLFIRSRDANGKWSVTNRFVFYKPPSSAGVTASNIVKAEYFFDDDPGFGNAVNIPVTPGIDVQNVSFNAGIDALQEGIHYLFIRSKNADGKWSITNRYILYKSKPANGLPPTDITNVEYFIDSNPAFGNAVPVAVNPTPNFSDFVMPVNISGLSVGDHQLYIRSRASNGWSVTNVYTFPIASVAPLPFINVNAITKKIMCAGDSVKISYDAKGIYNAGNIFNVEVSDAAGNFGSPIIIGSYTGLASTIINSSMPSHIPDGTNYRVRVSSTNPAVTGISGSDALTLHDRPYTQTITGRTQVNGTYTWPYSVPTAPGSQWNWIVTGGTLTSGQTTNTTTLLWSQPGVESFTGNIDVIETNQYGCVGDLSTVPVIIYRLRIKDTVPATACSADIITVKTGSTGAYDAGNNFIAELSDANGSFSGPLSSASLVANGNGINQLHSISLPIPFGIPNGTGYRIRVRSTIPVFAGDTSSAMSIIKPAMGADLNRTYCIGRGYNLVQNFTDNSLTYTYYDQGFVSLTRPDSVEAGTYQVVGTNSQGCKDTVSLILAGNPKPNLGPDTTVYHLCTGETTNLNQLYTTTGLTTVWNTGNPAAVIPGTYRLVVTNTFGCTDTAFAFVVLEVATWTGTGSSDWHTAANWNIGKVPTEKTHVIVPGGTPNPCIISNNNATAASIQPRNGATVQISNNRVVDIKGKCAALPPN